MTVKKFFAAFSAAALTLTLGACSFTGIPEENGTTAPAGTTAAAESTAPVGSGAEYTPAVTDAQPSSSVASVSGADTTAQVPGGFTPSFEIPGVRTGVTAKGNIISEKDGITYIDGIMIVNKTCSLPEGYAPGGLTDECAAAFNEMAAAAYADGISLWVQSGYRSYETQAGLYSRYCAEDGQDAADRYSARPGHSEHQTGLAIDVNSVYSSFADTPEGIWLAAHCPEYGFILRYPQGKESSTGYMYEPWHVRYIGDRSLAREITDSGLSLEEYFGII